MIDTQTFAMFVCPLCDFKIGITPERFRERGCPPSCRVCGGEMTFTNAQDWFQCSRYGLSDDYR